LKVRPKGMAIGGIEYKPGDTPEAGETKRIKAKK
jgi:hypothetical protein